VPFLSFSRIGAVAFAAGVAVTVFGCIGGGSGGSGGGGSASDSGDGSGGIELASYNNNLSNSLAYDIRHGNLENVKILIEQRANPNSVIECNGNNFYISSLSIFGNLEVAYYLLPRLNKEALSELLTFLLRNKKANGYIRKLYYNGHLDKLSDEQKGQYYVNSLEWSTIIGGDSSLNSNVVLPEFKVYKQNDMTSQFTLDLVFEYNEERKEIDIVTKGSGSGSLSGLYDCRVS